MAFKATNVIPEDAYKRAKRTAANVKLHSNAAITKFAATGANFADLRDLYVFLKNADADFGSISTTPGLAAYAQAQENDAEYNVAEQFTAMRASIQSAMAWVSANAPTNVTALAPASWTSEGTLIATTFTVLQTAGMRAQLQTVVDSIA